MVEVGSYPTPIVTFKCRRCPKTTTATVQMARHLGMPEHCGYYMEVR